MIAILTCVFIVALILLDWARGRSLNTRDLILIALGISGACFQCTLIVDLCLSKLLVDVGDLGHSYAVLLQLQMWTGSSSAWLTACLCIFYCVKIVDCNHRLFIWLKLRISTVVLWLQLWSVLEPLVLSVPIYWDSYRSFNDHSTMGLKSNSTVSSAKVKFQISYMSVAEPLGFCIPLLLGVVSITPILPSLYRHTRRMKENASGFSQPRLGAHISAARMLVALLLIYLVVILTSVLHALVSSELSIIVSDVSIAWITPAESTILILGNTRLKQVLWKVLLPCKQ
ncbi:taste receptor type 2 member 9-like [Lissotriton helveticus]